MLRSPLLLALAVILEAAACAPRHVRTTPDLGQQPTQERATAEAAEPAPGRKAPAPEPVQALEEYIARVRRMSWSARPAGIRTGLATIEASNARLAHSLAALQVFPSAARHIEAADAYRKVGVLDKAHEQLTLAVRLDRRSARAYDGLARIWRDWGFPNMGLADAHRAVFHAPTSPEAHNTLGTLLQALGSPAGARAEYERALALEPRAAYALNNLCALDLVAGDAGAAALRCGDAVRLDPTLAAAHHNLEQARAALRAAALETPDGRH
jgi:tetratricopeptide (TPR) repeat protein